MQPRHSHSFFLSVHISQGKFKRKYHQPLPLQFLLSSKDTEYLQSLSSNPNIIKLNGPGNKKKCSFEFQKPDPFREKKDLFYGQPNKCNDFNFNTFERKSWRWWGLFPRRYCSGLCFDCSFDVFCFFINQTICILIKTSKVLREIVADKGNVSEVLKERNQGRNLTVRLYE